MGAKTLFPILIFKAPVLLFFFTSVFRERVYIYLEIGLNLNPKP